MGLVKAHTWYNYHQHVWAFFVRLCPNTLSRFIGTAGMRGKVNRAVARQSEGGFGYGAISL